jgi:GR25 family glycosyltransferase involved in LPS biosynthesis
LLRADAVRKVGGFDQRADHFELDFAHRYTKIGYRSAFFDSIHCLHIGALTTERDSSRPPNAYDLNQASQFGGSHPPAIDAPSIGAVEGLDVRVINLDRRPDRWQAFLNGARRAGTDAFARQVQRHSAVDAIALEMTPEIDHLFRGNDFGSRRTLIACALSHLAVWEAVALGEGRACLIFEDDAQLTSGFTDQLASVRSQLSKLVVPFDLAYLGYSSWRGPAAHAAPQDALRVTVTPMDWSDHLGGSWAYVVTRPAARRLLALAEREGIHHGIDWFVMRQAAADLHVMAVEPHLVSAPVVEPGTDGDSNVQHDFEPLR